MTTATTAASSSAGQDWAPFRDLLDARRADCVRRRELALAETVTSVPDPVAARRAVSLTQTVEEIDAALGRLAAGTYGRCVHCGAVIAPERLESRPFASGCVSCEQPR